MKHLNQPEWAWLYRVVVDTRLVYFNYIKPLLLKKKKTDTGEKV